MPNAKKSLAETHPEVAKQWHPTENGNLTPNDVTKGSIKKVWWKCNKGEDHEWVATINSRTSQLVNCSVCAGRTVVKSNCLATINPEIAKQWHPELNGDLTPNDVTYASNKKVWWKCEKGDDHEWIDTIANRTYKSYGCKICSNRKVVLSNCLATTHPELAKQWHPTLNGDLTPFDIVSGSEKKIWWKCGKGDDHIWETKCTRRAAKEKNVIKAGCPYCSGRYPSKGNNLLDCFPKIANEWHPTLNGNLKPKDVTPISGKKVWWICNKNNKHQWETSVSKRTSVNEKTGCPYCSGRKFLNEESFGALYPEIAKEWHPKLNGKKIPFDYPPKSGEKVWWECSKDENHTWNTIIGHRTGNNSGCPYCDLTPQSKQELTITFELMKFFKNIDPKGLKTKLEGRLRAIDVFIPKLNLCIEFDGNYWHKDKRELDKIKSEMLFEEGFKLIRVRQEPLKKIYETDVISKQPYNGKQVTNDILSVILEMYELDDKIVSKINEYQSKDKLQNEKGLERYIDKILTEKAERKSSKTKTAK